MRPSGKGGLSRTRMILNGRAWGMAEMVLVDATEMGGLLVMTFRSRLLDQESLDQEIPSQVEPQVFHPHPGTLAAATLEVATQMAWRHLDETCQGGEMESGSPGQFLPVGDAIEPT